MKASGWSRASWLAVAWVAVWVGGPVRAQGFMVQPMRIVIDGSPGANLRTNLTLFNTTAATIQTLRGRLRSLGQGTSGHWEFDETPDPNKTDERSCLPWISLDADTVEVAPAMSGKFAIDFHVPPRAKGSYYACLLVATVPPKGATGISLVVQFLVPIIINIQGPPAKEIVQIDAPSLNDVPPQPAVPGKDGKPGTEAKPGTTELIVPLVNAGETYTMVGGMVTLSVQKDGRWRRITTKDYPERGMLPNHTVQRSVALGRRLPKGHYKVTCSMTVGGTLKRRTETEFDFDGAADVEQVECDVELLVTPSQLQLSGRPGARGGLPLSIQNTGDDPVVVSLSARTPAGMADVVSADLKGNDFACTQWLRFSPAQFTLPGRGTRSVRIDAQWPEGSAYPVHYAEVVVQAAHASGVEAGKTVVPFQVRDKQAKIELKAHCETLNANASATGETSAQATFYNLSLAEWSGTASITLRDAKGATLLQSAMTVDRTIVLPLGKLQGTASLDLSKVPDGKYYLMAALQFGGAEPARRTVPVVVRTVGGKKALEIISETPAAPAK